jgi:hypothetical protein
MADFLGNGNYVGWNCGTALAGTASGGTIVLSGDYRQSTDTPSIDLVDVSAGADTSKTYLTSLKDGKYNLTMLSQTGGTVLLSCLEEGVQGTLTIGEEGTASGKPKTSFPAICMGAKRNIQYANAVEISVDFQQNGTRTYGTF